MSIVWPLISVNLSSGAVRGSLVGRGGGSLLAANKAVATDVGEQAVVELNAKLLLQIDPHTA